MKRALDEVRIYDRGLTAGEVAARYAAEPEDQETIHYYLGGKQVAFSESQHRSPILRSDKKGDTLY